MARCRVHHLVNPWQREAVFGTYLVEIGEVNADSPLIILLLLRRDQISEPFRVVCFSDEVGLSNRSTSSLRSVTYLCSSFSASAYRFDLQIDG